MTLSGLIHPSELGRYAMRVLIVEDSEIAREQLSRLVALLGDHEITCASGGREAMALMGTSGGSFDAVITDVRMPDGNGLALVQYMGAMLDDPPPCLMLSTMPTFLSGRDELDLSELPNTFPFVTFELKTARPEIYVEKFLNACDPP